mmetsp:Transcript_7901/g.17089  ORF Transcript_7901/g.17089 Transcript_7901/m.17089 type:complete len:91 (+) Transcript_7901:64-336(+)
MSAQCHVSDEPAALSPLYTIQDNLRPCHGNLRYSNLDQMENPTAYAPPSNPHTTKLNAILLALEDPSPVPSSSTFPDGSDFFSFASLDTP